MPPTNILKTHRSMTLRGLVPDDEDERALFDDAMRGVRPLRPARSAQLSGASAARRRPRAQARFARADRRAVLQESLAASGTALTPVIEAGEELLYHRAGVSPQIFRQLRRGQYRVEAECDLHGLTQPEAEQVLSAFLAEALLRGWRVLRVVHGKGLRSGQRGPVLKHLVNGYLQRVGPVLAFASGREVDGGVGATLVLLASRTRRG
jgi:DNA-nicking Smr family endonuclease